MDTNSTTDLDIEVDSLFVAHCHHSHERMKTEAAESCSNFEHISKQLLRDTGDSPSFPTNDAVCIELYTMFKNVWKRLVDTNRKLLNASMKLEHAKQCSFAPNRHTRCEDN